MKKPQSLKEALKGKLSEEEISKVKRAFDLIGDIVVMEIPEGLEEKKEMIAKAVMEVQTNVRSVFKKASGMEGEYRVRKLELLAGEGGTETIYKENGCAFKLDISKVYFSPRLSTERMRIAELCKEEEKVLALFAGVGPFPIVCAKKKKCKCIGIELNPVACEYFRFNIKLNKVQDLIEVVEGDVSKIVPGLKFAQEADRILMTLPKDAYQFLPFVLPYAKKGAIVHIYGFYPEENLYSDLENKINDFAQACSRKAETVNKKIVRPYSPRVYQVAMDFRII